MKDRIKIPNQFSRCVVSDCAAAEHCLRHRAFELANETDKQFWAINPKAAQPNAGTACPHYIEVTPIMMARGFNNAIASLPSGNVKSVSTELSNSYGQRTYYKLRNGERSLTPEQQKAIAEVLERYGAKTPVVFDFSYEDYAWE